MTNSGVRWVAKLTADSAADIEALVGLSLGLDVWERHDDGLVVAASEAQLLELERRRLERWLQRGEIWVAPIINPDGHEFSRAENRLWRKNRRQNADGSFGVDPNR